MPENPYPFDNDAYQKAVVSLNFHIGELWSAGASEQQIRTEVDTAFAQIEQSPDNSVGGAPLDPAEEDADPAEEDADPAEEDADPAEEDEEATQAAIEAEIVDTEPSDEYAGVSV